MVTRASAQVQPTSWCHSGRLVLAAVLALAGCVHYQAKPLDPKRVAAAFEARSLSSAPVNAFLDANHVAPPAAEEPWGLKQLTLVAFYYQPALEEARAQLLAVQAAQVTAADRPNPSLSLTPGYDSGIPGSTSPWIVPLSFDVPIETAGKRNYRMEQARHLAEAAGWRIVGTVWHTRSQVRTALLDLYAGQATEALSAHEEEAEQNVLGLLEGQLAAGVISRYEVTQARISVEKARLAREQAAAQLRQAQVRLAGALGLSAQALAGAHFSFAAFSQLPRELTSSGVRREALLNRADIRAALADYAASQSALQLEIANQYPDIHLGPGYAWNTGSAGDSEWDLGLNLTLPVFNRNRGPIAEANARRNAAAAHFLAVQAGAVSEIDSALTAYAAALQQTSVVEGMQQNLRQRLHSTRERVEAGEAEPLAAASAEVEFVTDTQSHLEALIKAQQALGQLEDAVQSPLTLTPAEVAAGRKNFPQGAP